MKFVCPVCGYVEEYDGDELPADFVCPQSAWKSLYQTGRRDDLGCRACCWRWQA